VNKAFGTGKGKMKSGGRRELVWFLLYSYIVWNFISLAEFGEILMLILGGYFRVEF
jgi:hypothetical protein